jgi:O-antigen ligase
MHPVDRSTPAARFRLTAEHVSDVALLLLALSVFLAPAGVAAGTLLLWLGFFGQLATRWRGMGPALSSCRRSHALVWITTLFVVYCLAQSLVLSVVQTGGPQPDMSVALKWALISVAIPSAYALAARPERLPLVLVLALAGLLAGMAWRLDWSLLLANPGRFLDSREDFGFSANAYGLYSGSALLGLLVLRWHCWRSASGQLRWWRFASWALATMVMLQGLLISKSRAAWLAFLVALTVALVVQARQHARPFAGPVTRAQRRLFMALVAATLIGLALLNTGRIADRMLDEVDIARNIAAMQVAKAPDSSLALRWHAQLVGAKLVAERPWLGWGAGTTEALMAASGEAGVRHKDGGVLKHLHNSYLEAAVQLGLIGLAMLLVIQLGLLEVVRRRLGLSTAKSPWNADVLVFLLAAMVLLMVWDLFEYRVIRQDWRGYWTLLAGASLAAGLRSLGTPR